MRASDDVTDEPGKPGSSIPPIRAIQHYLVRRLSPATLGNMGLFWPALAGFGRLCQLPWFPCIPGIPCIPVFRVFRVFPCIPGRCTFGVSLLLSDQKSEFTSSFGRKSQAPFDQKSYLLLAKSSLEHHALLARSRLSFWPEAGSFWPERSRLWPKRSRLWPKKAGSSGQRRPYGPYYT